MSDYMGVKFGDYHSYDDWGLRLKDVSIGLPEAKTEYVEVPGMNGTLDITEAQNGAIRYSMRTLTFTFNARYCNYEEWLTLISTISEAIEGQEVKIIIDFDSGYYYTGRCHINTTKTNRVLAEITIEANCDPYKIDVSASNEPWLWDPFSFVDGVTTTTADITINSTTGQAVEVTGYPHNDTLTIISNTTMTMTFDGTEYAIKNGTNELDDVELQEGTNYLYFTGKGTITIISRGGRI